MILLLEGIIMQNVRIKILVCHHKQSPYIKNECVLPIEVGKFLHTTKLDYCIGDDTGDNISKKNPYWCELTALYWAWKNLDADYYGLMHYRRYLSFENNEGYQVITSLREKSIQESLKPTNIYNFCRDVDIITGPIWPIHPVGLDNLVMSSYDFYKREHVQADMDITLSVIKDKYPDFYFAALDELSSNYCFFMNLMVLKKELFYSYCEFLFGVLNEVEKKINLNNRDSYQKRVFGFLAERLSNIFVIYCQQKNPNLTIKHTGMYFLAEKQTIDAKSLIKQIINKEDVLLDDNTSSPINICMSFDDNYLIPALTTLKSILKHTKSYINLYVLCDNRLSETSRNIVKNNLSNNFNILFVDVDPGILNYMPLNRTYISINTYYRLLIHKLINVDKIIYLDSDLIVADDIRKLWDIDIKEFCIAGVLDEGGVMQSRRLHLGTKSNYINAGVIILNIKEIKKLYSNPLKSYLETYYYNRKYITLQDQDILNIIFKDSILVLPLKWNVNGRIFEVNELDHKYNDDDVKTALKDLGIIHFTDRKKPWKFQATHPLKSIYWYYRKMIHDVPLTFSEKKSIFLQEHFIYSINGNIITIYCSKIKLSFNKEKLKKTLRMIGFNF
jgi:lipopolysaccharide biosynthesis glycosyltransferase